MRRANESARIESASQHEPRRDLVVATRLEDSTAGTNSGMTGRQDERGEGGPSERGEGDVR
jgi:hypothetical protein